MILERLNLPELLEEEKQTLQELEKLKTSQKANPVQQKKSPCVRSEINRTTGIIVERTIENIASVSHINSEIKKNEKEIVTSEQTSINKVETRLCALSSQAVSKSKVVSNQLDKSLTVHDKSLSDMLNSSNEDEDSVNVSSIAGSLHVGETFTDLTSQSSVVASNMPGKINDTKLPSKTSTPICAKQGKGIAFVTKVVDKTETTGGTNLEPTNINSPVTSEKSAIRKTIENRLTQVSHRSIVPDELKSISEANNDILTVIEGEHKLICVTDNQAKKSREKTGKKLSSLLKKKLDAVAAKDKQNEKEIKNDKDDFEKENPICAVRKRKRIAMIENESDESSDNHIDSATDKTNRNSVEKDIENATSPKDKFKSTKTVKKTTNKLSENFVKGGSGNKHSIKSHTSNKQVNESSNISTPSSKVSNSTLSKLQKFAFDVSKSDRSSSSDSFLSNTSLSSSMLSGSLWVPDKNCEKSCEKSETKCVSYSSELLTLDETSNKKDTSSAFVNGKVPDKEKTENENKPQNSIVTALSSSAATDSEIAKARTDLHQKFGLTSKHVSQKDKLKNISNTSSAHSVLQATENTSILNKSSVLTASSPSWLAALKSKKPSPIFSISEADDLDLDLDDLEFSDNPLKRQKFS